MQSIYYSMKSRNYRNYEFNPVQKKLETNRNSFFKFYTVIYP